MLVDPTDVFRGTLLFAVPHMDDEVLACGGTIVRLPDKGRMHFLFATDGARSPEPPFSWMGIAPTELPQIRQAEARNALAVLGIPETNLHFLCLPDGDLKSHVETMEDAISNLAHTIEADIVFAPFRFDRHPDHIALHRAAVNALRREDRETALYQYFVYYRWRLLPGGDVRRFIRDDLLQEVDISDVSDQKLESLARYETQTTTMFSWQHRPILPETRLEEVSKTPEMFLISSPAGRDSHVFYRLGWIIPFIHFAEPRLKMVKDRIGTLLRRPFRGRG